MNRSALAACAVVSLCGTSHGFSLVTFGQGPEQQPSGPPIQKDVAPSSGQFRLAEVYDASSSAYVPEFNNNIYGLVTGVASTWSTRRADINNSTWFAGDPTGPDGAYTVGTGANNRPAWNAGYSSNPTYTGSGTPTGLTWVGAGDGDNLVSSIDPGGAGWGFAYDRNPSPGISGMVSNVSPLGGPNILDGLSYDWTESVFVGHFALTDPTAHLEGAFVLLMFDRGSPEGFEVNLDGTIVFDMKLVQVRDGNSINLFVVEIPAPSALGATGLCGVMVARRRRR